MNRTMRYLLRVVLLVPALGLLPLGCRPTDARQPNAPPTPATAPAEKRADAMPQHAAEEKQITIDNFSFDPPELTVPAGTRVTWLNRDDVPHTATHSTKPRTFDS